ncbi:restriction endonuclease subunit S [Methylobacterium sp. J-090]|uniref:restriction endonuclease subunit S n=1 Tax=Methylobacterium sp. J-090 TaxID=2836666 RepID=UPI001FBB04B0|nr:restriction endonuclease subunit S [Methylobacterium sp. J-090]MCJ2081692.1 restriction endonuclease subunit S [Methylobacterium sp. J-090]
MFDQENKATRTGGRAATTGVIKGRYALSVGHPGTPSPSGWSWTLLTDVARLETGHTPSRRRPEWWGGDIPWIGIRDATGNHGRTIFETAENTNAQGIANSSARVLPAQTVCLSRTASVGYVIVMGRSMATSQDFVNWVCTKSLDYRFLKYVLIAEREALLSYASGTTHQTIYFPEVKAFYVCLPPIQEQARIAVILNVLDDKIELNQRIASNLESVARETYQNWFVQFNPVHARATGSSSGLSDSLASLFPKSFGDEGLPTGWIKKPLADTFRLTMGQSPPGSTYNETGKGMPFYQGRTDFGARYPTRRVYCTAPLRTAYPGDTLVSVRAPVGDINMAEDECCLGRGVAAVRHNSGSSSYTFYSVTALRPQIASFDNDGTVFGAINRKQFEALLLVDPGEACISAFDKFARPLEQRIRLAFQQIETLSALRNTLLPSLVSGKLRIAEAEKIVSAA